MLELSFCKMSAILFLHFEWIIFKNDVFKNNEFATKYLIEASLKLYLPSFFLEAKMKISLTYYSLNSVFLFIDSHYGGRDN